MQYVGNSWTSILRDKLFQLLLSCINWKNKNSEIMQILSLAITVIQFLFNLKIRFQCRYTFMYVRAHKVRCVVDMACRSLQK